MKAPAPPPPGSIQNGVTYDVESTDTILSTYNAIVYVFDESKKWKPLLDNYVTVYCVDTGGQDLKSRYCITFVGQRKKILEYKISSLTKAKIKDAFVRWHDDETTIGARFSKPDAAMKFHQQILDFVSELVPYAKVNKKNIMKQDSSASTGSSNEERPISPCSLPDLTPPLQKEVITLNIQVSASVQTQFRATSDMSLSNVLHTVCMTEKLDANLHMFQYTDIKDATLSSDLQILDLRSKNLKLVNSNKEVRKSSTDQKTEKKKTTSKFGLFFAKNKNETRSVVSPERDGELKLDTEDHIWNGFLNLANLHAAELSNARVVAIVESFVQERGGYTFLRQVNDQKMSPQLADDLNVLAGQVHGLGQSPSPELVRREESDDGMNVSELSGRSPSLDDLLGSPASSTGSTTTLERQKKRKKRAPPPPGGGMSKSLSVEESNQRYERIPDIRAEVNALNKASPAGKRRAPAVPPQARSLSPLASPTISQEDSFSPDKNEVKKNIDDKPPPIFVPPPPPHEPPPDETQLTPIGPLSPTSNHDSQFMIYNAVAPIDLDKDFADAAVDKTISGEIVKNDTEEEELALADLDTILSDEDDDGDNEKEEEQKINDSTKDKEATKSYSDNIKPIETTVKVIGKELIRDTKKETQEEKDIKGIKVDTTTDIYKEEEDENSNGTFTTIVNEDTTDDRKLSLSPQKPEVPIQNAPKPDIVQKPDVTIQDVPKPDLMQKPVVPIQKVPEQPDLIQNLTQNAQLQPDNIQNAQQQLLQQQLLQLQLQVIQQQQMLLASGLQMPYGIPGAQAPPLQQPMVVNQQQPPPIVQPNPSTRQSSGPSTMASTDMPSTLQNIPETAKETTPAVPILPQAPMVPIHTGVSSSSVSAVTRQESTEKLRDRSYSQPARSSHPIVAKRPPSGLYAKLKAKTAAANKPVIEPNKVESNVPVVIETNDVQSINKMNSNTVSKTEKNRSNSLEIIKPELHDDVTEKDEIVSNTSDKGSSPTNIVSLKGSVSVQPSTSINNVINSVPMKASTGSESKSIVSVKEQDKKEIVRPMPIQSEESKSTITPSSHKVVDVITPEQSYKELNNNRVETVVASNNLEKPEVKEIEIKPQVKEAQIDPQVKETQIMSQVKETQPIPKETYNPSSVVVFPDERKKNNFIVNESPITKIKKTFDPNKEQQNNIIINESPIEEVKKAYYPNSVIVSPGEHKNNTIVNESPIAEAKKVFDSDSVVVFPDQNNNSSNEIALSKPINNVQTLKYNSDSVVRFPDEEKSELVKPRTNSIGTASSNQKYIGTARPDSYYQPISKPSNVVRSAINAYSNSSENRKEPINNPSVVAQPPKQGGTVLQSTVVVAQPPKQGGTVLQSTVDVAQAPKQSATTAQLFKDNVTVTQPYKDNVTVTQPYKENAPAAQPFKENAPVAQPFKETAVVAQPIKQNASVTLPPKQNVNILQVFKQTAPITQPPKQNANVPQPVNQSFTALQNTAYSRPTEVVSSRVDTKETSKDIPNESPRERLIRNIHDFGSPDDAKSTNQIPQQNTNQLLSNNSTLSYSKQNGSTTQPLKQNASVIKGTKQNAAVSQPPKLSPTATQPFIQNTSFTRPSDNYSVLADSVKPSDLSRKSQTLPAQHIKSVPIKKEYIYDASKLLPASKSIVLTEERKPPGVRPKPDRRDSLPIEEKLAWSKSAYVRNIIEDPGARKTTTTGTVGGLKLGFAEDSSVSLKQNASLVQGTRQNAALSQPPKLSPTATQTTTGTVGGLKPGFAEDAEDGEEHTIRPSDRARARHPSIKKEPPKTLPKRQLSRTKSTEEDGERNVKPSELFGVSKTLPRQFKTHKVDLRSSAM